ncbi:MAG TPA: sugar ABC transporter permease [Kofleriaceae bacterium]|nr:sugar ABC transporter permease [Kofleriaceae bacterium]
MRSASTSLPALPVVRRALRDFAVGAVCALAIATAAFVGVRNRELAAKQLALAERAAEAAARHHGDVPGAHAVLVGPPQPSAKYPVLRHRSVLEPGGWRVLAGARDDKLRFDAANRFDRDGSFAELLPDSRAVAAAPARGTVAVAITEPAELAPFPWLVVIGVLGLGAAVAAAGALAGTRSRVLGALAGLAALAVPPMLWGSWIAGSAILGIAGAVAAAQRAELTDRLALGMRRHRTALGFLAPAAIAMLVLVAVPFLIGIAIGFYDYHSGHWTFVGFHNFAELLSGGGHSLDDPLNFWFILGVTVVWTVVNIALHVTIGVSLALVLSRKWLRGRRVFRMLLILPWAIPNYITALMWHGMFQGEYGAINQILHKFGISDVSWFTTWAKAFAADVTTNTWLGFPFMMVVALGALETIPRELYEAASVDGASAWQRFRHITLPHLRPALGPAVALGSIWTFNMFNVIYLVSAGKPGDSTNILVTDAYRWAFERGDRYGMAAAEAALIFLVLMLWTVFGTRLVRRKEAA